jgi:hypothetical protein
MVAGAASVSPIAVETNFPLLISIHRSNPHFDQLKNELQSVSVVWNGIKDI